MVLYKIERELDQAQVTADAPTSPHWGKLQKAHSGTTSLRKGLRGSSLNTGQGGLTAHLAHRTASLCAYWIYGRERGTMRGMTEQRLCPLQGGGSGKATVHRALSSTPIISYSEGWPLLLLTGTLEHLTRISNPDRNSLSSWHAQINYSGDIEVSAHFSDNLAMTFVDKISTWHSLLWRFIQIAISHSQI